MCGFRVELRVQPRLDTWLDTPSKPTGRTGLFLPTTIPRLSNTSASGGWTMVGHESRLALLSVLIWIFVLELDRFLDSLTQSY